MDDLKFGPSVLLKIVDLVRQGLMEKKDISQLLRDLRLRVVDGEERLLEIQEDVVANV